MSGPGVLIEGVADGSAAHGAGIRPGDRLLAIGGRPVADVIDYMYLSDGEALRLDLQRGGERLEARLHITPGEDPGLDLEAIRVRSCGNDCVFCFVAQQPGGMRRPLYLKDDDYRMSFLYGNYITMTNLTPRDMERIAAQRLSPMYVSVHTTDDTLRRRMLGNPKAPPVMEGLRRFAEERIFMHTQIVLCPGYNDGAELDRTLGDLTSLYPHVQSVAVVPVGLTAMHNEALRPLSGEDARSALRIVDAHAARCEREHSDPLVYGADELYLKAGREFPPLERYGELPQMENGVGMVPSFLHEAGEVLAGAGPPEVCNHRYLTVTGESFHPYLVGFARGLEAKGLSVTPVMAPNGMFGGHVSVAGLLGGSDVLGAVGGHGVGGYDAMLLPDVMLKEGAPVFLDGMGVDELEQALGVRVIIVEASPWGLMQGIEEARGGGVR